jgi:hypothetical protein
MHRARYLCGDRHTTWSTSLDNSRESQDSILLQWHCWARGAGEETLSATLGGFFFIQVINVLPGLFCNSCGEMF